MATRVVEIWRATSKKNLPTPKAHLQDVDQVTFWGMLSRSRAGKQTTSCTSPSSLQWLKWVKSTPPALHKTYPDASLARTNKKVIKIVPTIQCRFKLRSLSKRNTRMMTSSRIKTGTDLWWDTIPTNCNSKSAKKVTMRNAKWISTKRTCNRRCSLKSCRVSSRRKNSRQSTRRRGASVK